MWVTTNYYDNSGLIDGLSPIVRIRDVETGDVVVSGTMSGMGNGFYKYEFLNYDMTKDYVIFCDAVVLSNAYRYKSMTTGEYGGLISDIRLISDEVDLRTVLIRQILTNRMASFDGSTDNLIVYADNDIDAIVTWHVTDSIGGSIIQDYHLSSKRSRGK